MRLANDQNRALAYALRHGLGPDDHQVDLAFDISTLRI
jgi:hypothetical protein